MKNDNSEQVREAISALADYELGDGEEMTESQMLGFVCHDEDAMASWQRIHLIRDVLQEDYNPALPSDFVSRVRHAIDHEVEYRADEYLPEENVVSLADARLKANRLGAVQANDQRSEEHNKQQYSHSRTDKLRVTRGRGRAVSPVAKEQPFTVWKPIVGLGLAASLAGVAFLSSQLWQATQLNTGSGTSVAAVQEKDTVETSIASATVENATAENTLGNLTRSDFPAPSTVAAHVDDRGTRWRTEGAVSRNQQIEDRLNTLLTNHLEDASMSGVQGLVSYSRIVGYDSVPEKE